MAAHAPRSPRRSGRSAPGRADVLDTQVIVVGAGPVGLLLTAELCLHGIQVAVVEQRHRPTKESRASTLHARTMEIFDSRGLLTDFASPPTEPRGHFGGLPLDLTLPGAYPGQHKVPQTKTESVLEEWALSLGADIRCGHRLELIDLVQDGEAVEAQAIGRDGRPVRLRGTYLVACDGQDSTVRRLTGAAFPGQEAGRELLRADVENIHVRDRRFERLPGGLAIAARRPDGVTRVMVHEFGAKAHQRTKPPRYEEMAAAWQRVTGEDISAGTPLWVNHFDDANRQLTHYRHGRVLYAGDAAHRQMPIGGQALNLGLQDAFNLGWKLAAVLAGHAPKGLLDTYHTERHQVGRAVLANIRAQAQLLLGGAEVEPLRAVLAELLDHEQVRTRLAGMISGLDIRYADCGTGHPLAGLRLPHARLRVGSATCTTLELLRSGRGLLLGLDGRVPAVGERWADRIDLVVARPEPDSDPGELDKVTAVAVRPDGYVVWAATSQQPDGTEELAAVLERWFGTPH
ncbi:MULTISPECIES: FAD-dependent monooxygenase [Streptomyces]|uniref:Oxidoreductase n=1 Tax=Streptomyces venezuelae TaxID=54571 RepID=A0A5P2B3U8_STRVZ|nr:MULTISPECIES: FAD-dependent monooxygenase [Streptomyces]NEA03206.1 oxidoreductase [Streptomyces sp. SID10116]MYY85211.1 oxidoreductase [Streptomyces sp. SID335]MYZ16155.1 oxidoreductase [Streptomyces sp. SID337]NDZ90883.1 oxidoreductase [Streptomyces sp. SID10115]NEB49016.1 oxidoreductase [Streptomyces sp. SID339]